MLAFEFPSGILQRVKSPKPVRSITTIHCHEFESIASNERALGAGREEHKKSMYESLSSLTARLDGMHDDAQLRELEAQMQEKTDDLQRQMDEHAENLQAKMDDGHDSLADSIDAMEKTLQELSSSSVTEVRVTKIVTKECEKVTRQLGEEISGVGEELAHLSERVDQHDKRLDTHGSRLTKCEKLLKELGEEMNGLADELSKLEDSVEEHDKLTDQRLNSHDKKLSAHDKKLERLFTELQMDEDGSNLQALIQQHARDELSAHEQERREVQIAKQLRGVMLRWTNKTLAAAFSGWHKYTVGHKRTRNLMHKSIVRMEHATLVQTFLPWLQAARQLESQRKDEALSSMEERASELSLGVEGLHGTVVGNMAEQRSQWIGLTLRKVHARWTKASIMRIFQRWHEQSEHRARTRNLMKKTIRRMDHLAIHNCFSPWLMAARARLKQQADQAMQEQQKKHIAASERISILEQRLQEMEDTSFADQLAAIHARLEELSEHPAGIDALQQNLEERLEHLEVSLRKEYQHVEVRCDIVSREFNRLRGGEWKDGLRPSEQPLESMFELESSAGRQLKELQQSMGAVQTEMEIVRGFLKKPTEPSAAPAAGASSEELAGLQAAVSTIEANVQRVLDLKASLDTVQQQQQDVQAKVEQYSEWCAEVRGVVSTFQDQLGSVQSSVEAQAAKAAVPVAAPAPVPAPSPAPTGSSEELASLQAAVSTMETSHAERVLDLKASLDAVQQQQQGAQAKLDQTTESIAEVRGVVSTFQDQLGSVQSSVEAQAAASVEVAELKAGMGSVEREISSMKNEQQQRQVVDGDHSASIAGLTAELNGLQQAHEQTQHDARDLTAAVTETKNQLSETRSQLASTRTQVVETRSEQGKMRSELSETRSEVVASKSATAALRSNLDAQEKTTQAGLSELRSSLQTIQSASTAHASKAETQAKLAVLEDAVAANKAEVADNAAVLETNLARLGETVQQLQAQDVSRVQRDEAREEAAARHHVALAQAEEARALAEAAQKEAEAEVAAAAMPEGTPPDTEGVLEEVGSITPPVSVLAELLPVFRSWATSPGVSQLSRWSRRSSGRQRRTTSRRPSGFAA